MNRRLFLCVAVLLSMVVGFAHLAEFPGAVLKMDKTWIEYAANDFAGGSGTQENPYRIATAGQLAYLAKTVNEGNMYQDYYFEQTKDIDLGKHEWVPIGTERGIYFRDPPLMRAMTQLGFKGHFNGKNNTIHGLRIKQFWGFSGLFGVVFGGSFKNVKLTAVAIENGYCSGGIVGAAFSGSGAQWDQRLPLKITNCAVEGRVVGFWCVGGMAGFLQGYNELSGNVVSVNLNVTYDQKKKYKTSYAEYAPENEHLIHLQVSPLFGMPPPDPRTFFTCAGGMVAWLSNEETNARVCEVNACTADVAFSGDISCLGSIVGFSDNSRVDFTDIRSAMDVKNVESARPPRIFFF